MLGISSRFFAAALAAPLFLSFLSRKTSSDSSLFPANQLFPSSLLLCFSFSHSLLLFSRSITRSLRQRSSCERERTRLSSPSSHERRRVFLSLSLSHVSCLALFFAHATGRDGRLPCAIYSSRLPLPSSLQSLAGERAWFLPFSRDIVSSSRELLPPSLLGRVRSKKKRLPRSDSDRMRLRSRDTQHADTRSGGGLDTHEDDLSPPMCVEAGK